MQDKKPDIKPIKTIEYPKYYVGRGGKRTLTRSVLSDHFKLAEYHCKCDDCVTTIVAPLLVNACECLRTLVGEPLQITSGYRCKSHNEKVGGADDSYHTLGLAVDIRTVSRQNNDRLYNAAKDHSEIGAIGRYINDKNELKRLHIDLRQVTKKIEWIKKE